jgi:hypothetical protein
MLERAFGGAAIADPIHGIGGISERNGYRFAYHGIVFHQQNPHRLVSSYLTPGRAAAPVADHAQPIMAPRRIGHIAQACVSGLV